MPLNNYPNYWAKYFNETTKYNIIKWLLPADQFPFNAIYENKPEYKQLESKVDKSILTLLLLSKE